jgi:hypothetical protein
MPCVLVCGRPPAEIVGLNPAEVMDNYYECCVLLGRGKYDELITRKEELYRLRCITVRDLETKNIRRSWPAFGRWATGKRIMPCNTVSSLAIDTRSSEYLTMRMFCPPNVITTC